MGQTKIENMSGQIYSCSLWCADLRDLQYLNHASLSAVDHTARTDQGHDCRAYGLHNINIARVSCLAVFVFSSHLLSSAHFDVVVSLTFLSVIRGAILNTLVGPTVHTETYISRYFYYYGGS